MAKHRGMTVDLENMLYQAGRCIESKYGYAYMLEQLGKHLRELRDRHRAGDTGVVDEFFALYVLDDKPGGRKGSDRWQWQLAEKEQVSQ